MRRTLAIAKRLGLQLIRDKRTLALIFFAPVLIMFLLNVMFSANTTTHSTIGLVNVNSSISKTLDDTKHVSVKHYSTKHKAKVAMKDKKIDAIIQETSAHHYDVTYSNTDSSKTSVAKQAFKAALTTSGVKKMQVTVHKLAAATGQQVQTKSAKNHVKTHYNYGDKDTNFFSKIIPILLGFFVFLFVFLISGLAILSERTSGTLERMLATPVKRSELIWGYLIAYGVLAFVQTIIIVLSTIWLLKVEVVGSIIDIIIINLLLAVVALAFGFLLSSFARSEFQMIQFIPIVIVPQVFFSGIIPLDQMASWVQIIGKVLPITYAGDALSKIVLHGATLADLGGDILALVIFIVVLMVLNTFALKKYRKV